MSKVACVPDLTLSFRCALNEDRTHADKENMYKNIQEYLNSMSFQTCFFENGYASIKISQFF